MPLAEYRRKRHFDNTPEPQGRKATSKGRRPKPVTLRFVVQKHDARRLHYDFRLELDGVLKSWAVPKGPCFDPAEKRLAVEVEDHPLEYAAFEGTIPAGQYGGGTVEVWDQGTWQAEGDPHDGLREGKLKFRLDGQKLIGRWTLVRMKRRPNDRATNWLLIKERDEAVRPLAEYDVTVALPNSVVSGRTLAEIAQHSESNSPADSPKTTKRAKERPTRRSKKSTPGELPGERVPMPETVALALASLVKKPPDEPHWLHEIKFDGYRILCRIERGKVQLITRGDQDWTERMGNIARAAAKLPVESAIIDGEVVVLLPDGMSSFQALQNAFQAHRERELVFYAFDLLYLDGHDLRSVPLERRKEILAGLLQGGGTQSRKSSPSAVIRYTDHITGKGEHVVAEASRLGLEGIISKRRDRPYVGGRGYNWVKTKFVRREEFVIGGFTDPSGTREGLGALLIGYYRPDGRLVYAGKVGTGFDDRLLIELRKRLDRIEQKSSPFLEVPAAFRKSHWVKPQLVGQIEFSNWTGDGRLRHPSFQGLREDKPAESVIRDEQTLSEVPEGDAMVTHAVKSNRGPSSRKSSQPANDEQRDPLGGIRLTNPERLLYPQEGITKLDLARFYTEIGDWILPHVVERPLSLLRCPKGLADKCFFHKHLDAGVAEALEQVMIREDDKDAPYLFVRDVDGILALVQMGVLEIHLWGARADSVEKPDRLVFDLDPEAGLPWSRAVEAAERVRDVLHEFDLESFVKTTGGKGLHVVVPIARRHEWPQIKSFAKGLAQRIATEAPDRYTINPLKARRVGRVFIDYLRNERGATSIAAYSTRARTGAPVSVPVAWKELKIDLSGDHFCVQNLPARLSKLKHDPWRELPSLRQSLTASALKAVS
ncbi:MAG TPA: DNA ligase D [Pirellulales bacterium]|nr:DNA ligase D [Pirellulales bacterium]